MSAEGGQARGTPLKASQPGPVPPARPVPAAPRASGGGASGAEVLAAVLKLGSALAALFAAVLFVLPAVGGDFSAKPRLITHSPTFTPAPKKGAPAVEQGSPKAPAAPAVEGASQGGRDPFETPEGMLPVAEAPVPDDIVEEERADFEGSILMLESEPSGAVAWVQGKDQGETPVSVGLDCKPGEAVLVEFVRRGYERATHTAPCPQDVMLKLTARLRKAAPKDAPRP